MPDNPLTTADKNEILKAIDRAKLSVLRGMHSGDKVARVLVNLVEEMHKTCPAPVWVCSGCMEFHDPELFKDEDPDHVTCPKCGAYMYFNDPEAMILETDVFKEADAYVLRINTIRDSKEKK